MQARSFFIALLIAFSVHDTCAMKRKHETEDLYSADTPPTLTLPYKLSNRDIFNAAQTNDYGQFLHIFGSFYLQVDKQSEALQCWKKDVKKYQGAKRSAANVGMVYGSLDNLPKAKKYFELAIKSGDKKTMHNLALIYERENNHVMAKQCYKQSITSCTENTPLSAHNLAVSFREKNNIKKAKKYYHLAADKYNFALSCNDLALIYEQENNHALATQYYAKIAEVNPHAATQAGILYYKQKKIDKAKKYFHLAADTHSHIIAAINLAAIYGNDEDNRKNAKKYYHLAADVPIDTMKSVYSFFGGKELYELNKQKLMQTKISARHNLVHIYTLEGNVAKANEYQQKLKK